MEKTYKDLLQQISEPTIADWIAAAASIFGVIVAIVAAFLVYRQIKQTSEQMQNSALKQALDSELRTRPYVYLELISGLWGEGSFDLKIKNSGKTFAREVRLEIPEDTYLDGEDSLVLGLRSLSAPGFDMPPDSSLRIAVYLPEDKSATPSSAMGIKSAGVLGVKYSFHSDLNKKLIECCESIDYNLDVLSKVMPLARSGANNAGNGKDLVNINNTLKSINHYLAENIR